MKNNTGSMKKKIAALLMVCFPWIAVFSAPPVLPVIPPSILDILRQSSEYNAGANLNRKLKELQQMRIESQLKRELETQDSEKKEDKKIQEDRPETPTVKVFLNKICISESEVLSNEEIYGITCEYEKREVEVCELYEAIDKINQLYQKKGFVTARATLPPQRVEDGVINILLIEGTVGSVNVENNKTTNENYIKKRLKVIPGKVPNLNRLNRRLQRFNGTNEPKIQIKLLPGEEPLTTDFYIQVYEPEKEHTTFLIDNSGSESSGKWRSSLIYSNNSLTGQCDLLNLTTMFSKDSETGAFSYSTPINAQGTKIAVNYSINKMRVGKGDLALLKIRGDSRTIGFTITHPSLVRVKRKEELIFDLQQQHSRTTIFGNEFVHDDERRVSFGVGRMDMSDYEIFYYKPLLVYSEYHGLLQSKYRTKLVFDALWQKQCKAGHICTVRFNSQKALDDYIPSADQYYLGGQYTVRGYEENGVGGDSGLNVKLDILWPTTINKDAKWLTFFDWGRISGKSLLTTREIYSVGWGFEQRFDSDTHMAITVGYPLVKRLGDVNVTSSVVHFSMSTVFN